jgi:hypothetical protein
MRRPVMARSRGTAAVILILAFALASGASTLRSQEANPRVAIRPGLGAEIFARTISWDQDLRESKLKTVLATVRGDFELAEGFVIGVFAGYGLTNPNGLVFRGLPFSIDYEAGSIGALLFGADLSKSLFQAGDFEFGLTARYEQSLAATSALEIASLNEAGTAEAKSAWQRVAAGPLVRYLGYERFSPFLAVTFDKLWGKFTMTEAIAELKGTEMKSVSGKGLFGITLGTDFAAAPGFRLAGEITAIPYKKLAGGLDVDYGIALRAVLGI